MSWNVGHEKIHLGDHIFEAQWEVDASSEEEAKNPDLVPYLLIGRLEHADVPYLEIEWVASSELGGQESIYTGTEDADGEPITVLLQPDEVRELVNIMDRASEGAALSDFA